MATGQRYRHGVGDSIHLSFALDTPELNPCINDFRKKCRWQLVIPRGHTSNPDGKRATRLVADAALIRPAN